MFLTEDEFYKDINNTLNESIITAASILGKLTLTALAAFGGALLLNSRLDKKSKRALKKALKRKGEDIDIDSIASKASSKREADKINSWTYRLSDVFKALEAKNLEEASKCYKSSKYEGNTDAIKAIAIKATEVYGQPPIYVYPSFNDTYKAIAKICGPKVGRAVASAVLLALKQNTSYYDNLKSQDIDIPNSYEY